MATQVWSVTTQHPTGYQDGVHTFTTHETQDTHNGPTVYYATADGFGCSKNYRTAESAIREMCADHACRVLSIVEVKQEVDAPAAETAAPDVSVSTTFHGVSLPDYVTDHCNGDDELLVGVAVGPDTTAESLLADVMSEVGQSDKIPDVITDDMIRAAIESDVNTASSVVGSMTACGTWDNYDEDSDEPYEASDSYAWFRITWAID